MNSIEPLVSVVIPTYNHSTLLKSAIESVLSQTYKNIEIIVIDNHSTDDTEEIISEFKCDYLKYIKIHNNGVIALSRNIGIKNATGEWLAFLDSDDIWYPKKIEIVVNSINENPECKVFCTDENIKNENGIYGVLKYGPYQKQNFYRYLIESGNCISTSACVVERSFIQKHQIQFSEDRRHITAEDYECWMRLAMNGAKFKFISSIQGEYFIHTKNQSGNTERHKSSVKAVLLDHVMKIQKFQEPNKLWRLIETRILVEEGLEEARQRNIKLMLCRILEALATGRLLFLKVIKIKLMNKFNDMVRKNLKV